MQEDLYDRSMTVGSFYHIYNRGVAKTNIFLDSNDYQRYLEALGYYLDDKRPSKLSTARKQQDNLPISTVKLPLSATPCLRLLAPSRGLFCVGPRRQPVAS